MRRIALSVLGFFGAFTPLMSLGFLSEAVNDGLDGDTLPALSSVVLNLAPFRPTLWIVPALIGVGVYIRTSRKTSLGDTVWAIVGAILMFSCNTGALMAAYNHFLFLDGPDRSPHSMAQRMCNITMVGGSVVFLAMGLGRRPAGAGQPGDGKPNPAAN